MDAAYQSEKRKAKDKRAYNQPSVGKKICRYITKTQ